MVMAEMLFSTIIVCICLTFTVDRIKNWRKASNFAPLPPGPKAAFILGNLRDIPSEYEWVRFSEWIKDFGNIIHMHVYGRPIIILNSFEHAQELMDKRGANHSDRPRMVLIHELLKVNSPTFIPYGEQWRKYRRMIQQYFNSRAIISYRPLQEYEVRKLLEDLRIDPQAYRRHVKRFIASVILTAAYGYQVASADDPFIELVERVTKMVLGPGLPGSSLVDYFPFCKEVFLSAGSPLTALEVRYIPSFLPGGHFQHHAILAHRVHEDMLDRSFKFVEEHRAAGDAIPSFTSTSLSQYEQSGEDDPEHLRRIKDIAGSLYRAGTESTATVILTFILAMTLNPSAAKKAQAELDTIVGRERLPSLDDRDSLPYVECILKETVRWNPPFPMGLSHRSLMEDELEGNRIPKGSIIMPNIWRMMHDDAHYLDSESFKPERFEKSEGRTPDLDPTLAIFGFGRRICPGRHFADATAWLAIACMLHMFYILPDTTGEEKTVYLPSRFQSSAVSPPKPFKCNIIPRADAIPSSE